jgi:aminoglycoside 6'-N-acetyltransferase I
VLEHIKNIRNIKNHPYEFYQKMGYTIVGICPDANGFGKPDIYMAKRVGEVTK